MKWRVWDIIFLAALWLAAASHVQAADAVVYKSPACGCCSGWVEHLRANGFNVQTHDLSDVTPHKIRLGVPPRLGSCHTALIDGYVIEGHVPAQDIKRLLEERPDIAGLAVPGMPSGSPGMSGPPQRYDVMSFEKNGDFKVYAQH